MSKRVVQIDNYDIVELWADGECRLRLMWDNDRKVIDTIIAGPMSSEATSPGIIAALRKEKLLDE